HAPGLVVLDEPFEGVDAVSVEIVRQLLTRLTERGTTVLVTTHILEAIQDICHRVGILAGGRLVRQFEGAELKSSGRTLRDLFVGAVMEGRRLPELPPWLVGKNG
ncbi:MAG: ABC transporter ATP-binding protein, partial [Deltaproteobacteria bacterium]